MKIEQRYTPVISGQDKILHGGDYNPDQWLHMPGKIDEDFRLMDASGTDTFSVGIFSWSALEPEEGVYNFDWLKEILDRLAAAGKFAFLATPTGGKPAWMSEKYPEIRRVKDHTGIREPHWERHNHCMTSPVYREFTHKMNTRLAEHFGNHPAVKLWHLSNEYNGECMCELCLDKFRWWLKEKYGSLDALNKAWWNMFWSHNYSDWSQVTPYDKIHDGMQLDWMRFTTWNTVDFMKAEIKAVREHSDLPVTTNFMGYFPGLDYWRFMPELDVVSHDGYPCYVGRCDETMSARGNSAVGDLMRSFGGGKPWILMESCITGLNWSAMFQLKRPGIHRREMLQNIAHGADATMYFQYRKGRGGSEKFHGAVVDHEGTEQPATFKEVQAHSALLEKLKPIVGTGVNAPAAIVFDWDSEWALKASHGPCQVYPDKGYRDTFHDHYGALWTRGVQMDVIEGRGDFSKYAMVSAPALYVVDEAIAEKMKAYVNQGGVLVISGFTAWVDNSNCCHLGGWPGLGLREAFGIWAEEPDGIPAGETVKVKGTGVLSGYDQEGEAVRFAEMIHAEAEDVEVLAEYASEFYAGRPAVLRRKVGEGWVYYVGPQLDQKSLSPLYDGIVVEHALPTTTPDRPEWGVVVRERHAGDERFVFVFNHTLEDKSVALHPGSYTDMETGETVDANFAIGPNGSRVLAIQG